MKSLLKIKLVFWKYFSIIVLISVIIFFEIKNNYEITILRQSGILTKGFIYEKKSVGSKGTIRSFYRFYVNDIYYEGFDDNEDLTKYDSILVIYNPENPELNRTKEFVEEY